MGAGITNGIIPSGGAAVLSRGALVTTGAHSTLTSGIAKNVEFTIEQYDTDNIHDNVTNPTRLTVPVGVTKVRLTGSVRFDVNTVGDRQISFTKNGGTVPPGMGIQKLRPGAGVAFMNIVSAITEVVPGEYFELQALQFSGADLNVVNSPQTWFALEVIQ